MLCSKERFSGLGAITTSSSRKNCWIMAYIHYWLILLLFVLLLYLEICVVFWVYLLFVNKSIFDCWIRFLFILFLWMRFLLCCRLLPSCELINLLRMDWFGHLDYLLRHNIIIDLGQWCLNIIFLCISLFEHL